MNGDYLSNTMLSSSTLPFLDCQVTCGMEWNFFQATVFSTRPNRRHRSVIMRNLTMMGKQKSMVSIHGLNSFNQLKKHTTSHLFHSSVVPWSLFSSGRFLFSLVQKRIDIKQSVSIVVVVICLSLFWIDSLHKPIFDGIDCRYIA